MSQPATAQRAVLHLSVTGEDRRLDLGVPAQVPLVEILPGVIRQLGVLDPSLVHGGFSLRRANGTQLDPAASCAAQGVTDGELLTLVRGSLVAERRRYDDVVEAVIDATHTRRTAWTPKDHARTALAVSLTLLGLGAALLAVSQRGLGLPAFLGIGAALVLVATGAVLTRVGQPESGNGLGLAATVYAGVGAYLLLPPGPVWGWPIAAAGLAMVIVGGAALATTGTGPQVHLVPIIIGTALGVTGLVSALVGPGSVAPYAVLVAVLGATSNVLPWIVLTSTRITVISPQSDAEVLVAPPPIDGEDVGRRAALGHKALLAARFAFGITILVVTPRVAAESLTGALLVGLAFIGLMFESRQVYARVEVATLMGLGTLGLAATGAVAAITGSIDQHWLLGGLLAATVVLVVQTMISDSVQMRLLRLYDALELACLAALLPLGAITAGLA
jgi:type VII secretion integral membrane protein EccD